MVLKETYNIAPEESKLYDDNTNAYKLISHVVKLRIFMEHLDEFDIKGNKVNGEEKYHVSSKFIAMLAEELGIPCLKLKAFVDYFTKHYQGEYVPVKYGIVNRVFGNIDNRAKEYIEFKSTADKLMEKYKETNNVEGKKKVAVTTNINYHSSILESLLA